MNGFGLILMLASAAAAQVPVFQSEARIVEIPVVARDSRHAPVRDLKARDLRLLDNGVEQRILSLEKFGAAGQAGDVAVSSRLGPKFSILVLDELNTPLQDEARGQKGLSDMLLKLGQRQERIALYVLGDELRLLCDFTSEPDILQTVIEHYQSEAGYASSSETYSLGRQRRVLTLDALTRIAGRMKGLPGEKSLIWMTAGFPPPEDRHGMYRVAGQLRDAKVRVYPIDARGLIACSPLPCLPQITLPIDMMEEIAGATGGRAYHDSNGLAALARSALDDSRPGYLLSYAPNNYRQDGSAHQVGLATTRKGLELHYRPGYTADGAVR